MIRSYHFQSERPRSWSIQSTPEYWHYSTVVLSTPIDVTRPSKYFFLPLFLGVYFMFRNFVHRFTKKNYLKYAKNSTTWLKQMPCAVFVCKSQICKKKNHHNFACLRHLKGLPRSWADLHMLCCILKCTYHWADSIKKSPCPNVCLSVCTIGCIFF